MMKFALLATVLVTFLGSLNAECPNACSSHGKCGQFDMCTCFRNWMANDCSERACPFGLAHVDTPKGDLDSSGGALSGPGSVVAENSDLYPYGTTEQFPAAKDSRGEVLTNTAHYYMECSNKGTCDRSAGLCECFPGYEGSSCQRASCPSSADGMCSGHGTCQTLKELAELDNGNYYELWDKDSTMGCKCDPGYYGPDCSQKKCKFGFDPLHNDGYATQRHANWTYVIYTRSTAQVFGNYSIVFYDAHGEDWQTDPIDISATCADVITALESLPNDVIPSGSVHCFADTTTYLPMSDETSLGTIFDGNIKIKARYTLTFPQNPGKLQQIELNKFLDGNRPTLYTDESSASTLGFFVYANGHTGETHDLVPDRCEGVTVTLIEAEINSKNDYLGNLDIATTKLLKSCLGRADGLTTQAALANDIYQWEHGSVINPHLIKLVDTTASPKTNICKSDGLCYNAKPPGFYAALFYHSDSGKFLLFNPIASNYVGTNFYVYTTTGYLQLTSKDVMAFDQVKYQSPAARIAGYHDQTMYTYNSSSLFPDNIGDLSCENAAAVNTSTAKYSSYGNGLLTCLNKEDYVMVFNPIIPTSTFTAAQVNPKYLNMYTLKKISREAKPVDSPSRSFDTGLTRHQLKFDIGTNSLYSFGDTSATDINYLVTQPSTYAWVYKFFPPANGGMYYAGECATRGICDATTGTCDCLPGYTNDDCTVQNAASK